MSKLPFLTDCRMPSEGAYLVTDIVHEAMTSGEPRSCTDSKPCDAHRPETEKTR